MEGESAKEGRYDQGGACLWINAHVYIDNVNLTSGCRMWVFVRFLRLYSIFAAFPVTFEASAEVQPQLDARQLVTAV